MIRDDPVLGSPGIIATSDIYNAETEDKVRQSGAIAFLSGEFSDKALSDILDEIIPA